MSYLEDEYEPDYYYPGDPEPEPEPVPEHEPEHGPEGDWQESTQKKGGKMKKLCITLAIVIVVGALVIACLNWLNPVPKIDVALGKVTFSGPDYIIIEDSLKGPMTLKIDPAKVKVKAGEIYSVKFDANNLKIIDVIGGTP